MNSYYFNKDKAKKLLESIRKNLTDNKNNISKAIELDYNEWEYKTDINLIYECINNIESKDYLPIFSKEQIIDGYGKVLLISNQNPYIIFSFILSAIYTNNKAEIILGNKMLATNKSIIEIVRKSLREENYEEDIIKEAEVKSFEDIVSKQDNYDLIYYLGNKSTYLNIIKRLHVDSKFEEFGEINICVDSEDYRSQIIKIDKWAYSNDIKVNLFRLDSENNVNEINNLNSISRMTIIFSKDVEKITKLSKQIKSQTIYVNMNPTENYKYDIDLENLTYRKVVKW